MVAPGGERWASQARHTALIGLLVVVVAGHLAALYWPVVTVSGPVSWTDKAVHVLLFVAPVLAAAAVLRRWRGPALVLAVHAPLSEWIQHALLPHRSGDPFDVAADLAGVALGAALAWWWGSRRGWSGASPRS